MIPQGAIVVGDTGVIVHLARADRTGQHILHEYALHQRPEKPVISVVTVGESLSLVQQFGWGQQKKDNLENLIRGNFVIADINHEPILRVYADIDAYSRQHGHKMGKNDLWIAATTAALGAAWPTGAWLLTCDKDF